MSASDHTESDLRQALAGAYRSSSTLRSLWRYRVLKFKRRVALLVSLHSRTGRALAYEIAQYHWPVTPQITAYCGTTRMGWRDVFRVRPIIVRSDGGWAWVYGYVDQPADAALLIAKMAFKEGAVGATCGRMLLMKELAEAAEARLDLGDLSSPPA